MKIAIAKEIEVGENRVAMAPDAVARLVKQGLEVLVETNAGERAFFADVDYEAVGARVVASTEQLWEEADILLKVNPPKIWEQSTEFDRLRPGSTLISFLNPLGNPELIQRLADRQITAFSMELIPRTTRAQSMDALSSQANIAGYKAVLLAAAALPGIFPMMTTAAGTIPPAKVFIIGAGVAGLQAIATARRLGAVVEAFDIRPAVKEEVQSLGAKFVEVALNEDTATSGGYAKEVSEDSKERSRQLISEHVKQSDVVITTAQVPGRKAPLLVTEEMVAQMKPGSVIVDLAAEQGGNCACTRAGRDIAYQGVTIIGPINLPSSMPIQASKLYGKNLLALLQYSIKDGVLQLNFEDDIINSTCVAHAGEICNPQVRNLLTVNV
ncbi:MAG: Re/Si-specific NAD(P)(+) transhydrogenase subunit alpha [Elainellaceae cyanobacterium]